MTASTPVEVKEALRPVYLVHDGEAWHYVGEAHTRDEAMELAVSSGWCLDEEDWDYVETGIEAHRVAAMRHQERLLAAHFDPGLAFNLAHALFDDLCDLLKDQRIEDFPVVCCESRREDGTWGHRVMPHPAWPEGRR